MSNPLFHQYYQKFESIKPTEVMPGFKGRFIHTEHLTLALWDIDAGSVLPMHQHPHEQVTQLLSGQFEMTVGDIFHEVGVNEIVTIPGHVIHGGKANSDCRVFDIFSPVREDYRFD